VRAEGTGEKLLHTEAEEGGTEEEKEGPPAGFHGCDGSVYKDR
jgi:hypothetical protein